MEEKKIEKKVIENQPFKENTSNIGKNVEKKTSPEKLSTAPEEKVDSSQKVIGEKYSENQSRGSQALSQSDSTKRKKDIENILEVDLADVYMKLSPEDKVKFKNKGEETAQAINSLLDNAKLKAKKILELIREWLKIIPGVNKFFIEHQAKVKLDKIMELRSK